MGWVEVTKSQGNQEAEAKGGASPKGDQKTGLRGIAGLKGN